MRSEEEVRAKKQFYAERKQTALNNKNYTEARFATIAYRLFRWMLNETDDLFILNEDLETFEKSSKDLKVEFKTNQRKTTRIPTEEFS